MGYSHYWYSKDNKWFSNAQFAEFTKQTKQIIDRARQPPYNIDLGELSLAKKYIAFNGNADKEEDHENFFMQQAQILGGQSCKTARKPYDTVVVACLLAATTITNGNVEISSDGNPLEWLAGFCLYHEACPNLAGTPNLYLNGLKLNFDLPDILIETIEAFLTEASNGFLNLSTKHIEAGSKTILALGGCNKKRVLDILDSQGFEVTSVNKTIADIADTIEGIEQIRWREKPDWTSKTYRSILEGLYGRYAFMRTACWNIYTSDRDLIAIAVDSRAEYAILQQWLSNEVIRVNYFPQEVPFDRKLALPNARRLTYSLTDTQLESKVRKLIDSVFSERANL